MKIGVHMSMFCREWTDDIVPYLYGIKEIGFDGVEISLFGAQEQDLYVSFDAARQIGLEVNIGTGVTADTDISSEDPLVQQNGIRYLKRAVDIAHKAGAKVLSGVLYAPWQSFSFDRGKEDRWKRSAQGLRQVGEYAEKAGICLCCEVLNRFESNFINTLWEGEKFIDLVGLDNVKLLADTFHMNIEEDSLLGALVDHVHSIGHIHVCENHRGVPGTGHISWPEIIRVLQKNHYTGYLTMECFVRSGGPVADALFTWRSHGDPLSEVERGFRYLHKLINRKLS